MGVICRLIKQMNEALGITSIVVSHDVQELATIAHDSFLLSGGKVVALGTPEELRAQRQSRKCASSWAGSPTARCRFTIRRRD